MSQQFEEIRAENGRFMGVLEAAVPADLRHLNVAIRAPFKLTIEPCVCEPMPVDIVTLEAGQWFEDAHIRRVWRVRQHDIDKLPNASNVLVAGQTERTWFGKLCDQREAFARLTCFLALAKWNISNVTRH